MIDSLLLWDFSNPIFQILLSVFLGAFVGLRRELELQKENISGFRGLRTTALVTVFGTISTFFAGSNSLYDYPLIFFLVLTGFILIAYWKGVNEGKIGLTSEVSLLLMYWVGVLFGKELFVTGIVLGLLVAISDAYKNKMHLFAKDLKLREWRGTLMMILITLVILPFLPKEAIDPWGVLIPYNIWILVILVTGIGFIGYFLNKLFSKSKIKGVYLTSFLGSLISSTAVTVQLSQKIKSKNNVPKYFIPSILLAIAVMEFRDLIIIMIAVKKMVWSFYATPIIMGISALILFYIYFRRDMNKKENIFLNIEESSPFEIKPAFKFAFVFSLILFIVFFVKKYLGDSGIYITTFLVSLIDTETIVLPGVESLKNGTINENLLGNIITISIVINTIVKLFYIWFFANSTAFNKILIPILLLSLLGSLPLIFW